MVVDGMGSRRSGNETFSLAAYHFENCLLSLNICNKMNIDLFDYARILGA